MTRAYPVNRAQHGSALVISIFFLLLLATLALTGLRASTTNVQIVGNMQARQEVTAAAQMLLEQTLSSDEFATNSARRVRCGKSGFRLQRRRSRRCCRSACASAGVLARPISVADRSRSVESAGCTLLCQCSFDQPRTTSGKRWSRRFSVR